MSLDFGQLLDWISAFKKDPLLSAQRRGAMSLDLGQLLDWISAFKKDPPQNEYELGYLARLGSELRLTCAGESSGSTDFSFESDYMRGAQDGLADIERGYCSIRKVKDSDHD